MTPPEDTTVSTSEQPDFHQLCLEAQRLRDSFLQHTRADARRKISHSTQSLNSLTLSLPPPPPVVRSLDQICDRKFSHCIIPKLHKPGRYTSWVPVDVYNKVTKLDEPYMPYFGDEDLNKAQTLYEAMCSDFSTESAFALPSDGEIDPSPSKPATHTRRKELSNDLQSLRLRAAQRHSILIILSRYGDSPSVWHALSKALNIRDKRRLKSIYDVAYRRDAEIKERTRIRASLSSLTNDIITAIHAPEQTKQFAKNSKRKSRITMTYLETIQTTGALTHYCSVCCQFACGLHDPTEKVFPIHPIPDLNTDFRMDLIKGESIKPCSQKCYLLPNWQQSVQERDEEEEWTAEEELILRDGLAVFRRDPCNLAVAVGTRPCRAVRQKIDAHDEQHWIEDTLRAMQRAHKSNPSSRYKEEIKRVRRMNAAEKKKENEDLKKKKKNKTKSGRPRKSCPEREDNASVLENSRYVPCNHPGPCNENEANCICVVKNVHCESRCGCNGARLTANSEGEIEWKGNDCGRGARGCSCKEGSCLGDKCVCVVDSVSCNPDSCTCDCRSLGTNARSRKCRNVDAIFGRHKKTCVGKSRYNFGLFAVEYFDKGDLVGIYYGNLLGEELIDKAIRIGQEMNSTYALDLTDDLTIDALAMGSKVKFVNHANSESEGANCECKYVSVRGEPYATLRTTKPVKPGEEFFFDYKLTHSEGNDWLWKPED